MLVQSIKPLRSCERCAISFPLQKPSSRQRFCSHRCAQSFHKSAYWERQRRALVARPLERLPDGSVRLPLFRVDGSVAAYALIDEADAPLVSQYRWGLDRAGYAWRRVGEHRRIHIWLHRVLLGLPHPRDGRDGDHINRDRLDNRRANLRVIPRSASPQNRGNFRGSSSQYRGVDWYPHGQNWRARIRTGDGLLHLGYFEREEDAAIAAQAAREWLLPYAVD